MRDLLHLYTAVVRPVLEYACPVWHWGLTAGQCNVIENIQERAIRVAYSDIDSDYETALIVARMDSLKDRREMLISRFFKKQVLPSNALLHYLLPERRDNDTISSLRNSQSFPQSEPAQISSTNLSCHTVISDIAIFVLKRDVKLQLTPAILFEKIHIVSLKSAK